MRPTKTIPEAAYGAALEALGESLGLWNLGFNEGRAEMMPGKRDESGVTAARYNREARKIEKLIDRARRLLLEGK